MIREGLSVLQGRLASGRTLENCVSIAMDLTDAGYRVSLERAAPADESTRDSLDHVRYLVEALAAGGLASACDVVVAAATPDADLDELVVHAHHAAVEIMVRPLVDVAATVAWAASMPEAPVGVILEAALRRTQADCACLADHRVRLVKGSGGVGAEATHAQPLEVDKAFVRCARTLLRGTGQPSFATRDARLVEIVDAVAARLGRPDESFELAVPYSGQEVRGAPAAGPPLRIWLPYGPGPRARLVGGFSEHPRTIAAAVRSLLPGM